MTQPAFTLIDFTFYVVAVGIIGTAVYATFSPNITRSVFSLLGTFFGVAILFGMMAADFVAIVQLMVYVGGILVLMIFAVMLTENINTAFKNNQSAGLLVGIAAGLTVLITLIVLVTRIPWEKGAADKYIPTTSEIGTMLLNEALLPFEVVSIVLLGIVIGAVVIARASKGNAADDKGEKS